jgi:hypothetical protein
VAYFRVTRLEAMCFVASKSATEWHQAKGSALRTCLRFRRASHFSIVFAEFALVGLPLRDRSQASVVTPNAITSTIIIATNIHRQATMFVTLDLISSRVCWSARGRSNTALNHVSGVHLNSA